jgi:hypothetical protein
VAAATARVRADWTASAGCAQIITTAIKRETAATTPTEKRLTANPIRSKQPK